MRLTNVLSIILHPVFMPLMAFIITLSVAPQIKEEINNIFVCYSIFCLGTVVAPVIILFILLQKKNISSIEMNNKKDRVLPLLITAACVFASHHQLKEVFEPPINVMVSGQIIGVITILVVASIVSVFWKISLHMLGAGGVVGVVIALYIVFNSEILHIILITIFFSLLLAFSRFKENAHNKKQLYVGFFLGLFIELTSISLQYYTNDFYFSF